VRWAAIEAYKVKGGIALGSLAVEVRGTRAAEEFAAYSVDREYQLRDAGRIEIEALIDGSAALSEKEYQRQLAAMELRHERELRAHTEADQTSRQTFFVVADAASGNHVDERYFSDFTRGIQDMHRIVPGLTPQQHMLRAQAIHDGLQAQTPGRIGSETPEVSVFHAIAGGVPALAHRLTEGYAPMLFHADLEPGTTVANALGAPDMDSLEQTWEGAMRQRTPLAAAQLVLSEFMPAA
jgi:hypothetical protein